MRELVGFLVAEWALKVPKPRCQGARSGPRFFDIFRKSFSGGRHEVEPNRPQLGAGPVGLAADAHVLSAACSDVLDAGERSDTHAEWGHVHCSAWEYIRQSCGEFAAAQAGIRPRPGSIRRRGNVERYPNRSRARCDQPQIRLERSPDRRAGFDKLKQKPRGRAVRNPLPEGKAPRSSSDAISDHPATGIRQPGGRHALPPSARRRCGTDRLRHARGDRKDSAR